MSIRKDDVHYMNCAFQAALPLRGVTWPNPPVGAAVVQADGRLLAVAATAVGGRPHAETRVLDQVGKRARGATLYVTLEPCCHYGETPPCVDAILQAGITTVVVSVEDPDPRMRGKSLRILRQAAVELRVGVMADYGAAFYAGYRYRIERKRPFVTVKLACSQDEKIARHNAQRTMISGDDVHEYVHWLRLHHDGIVIGSKTCLHDDPLLTCRLDGIDSMAQRSLARIVLDADLRIPLTARLLADVQNHPVWFITHHKGNRQKKAQLSQKGCRMIELDRQKPFPVTMMLSALADCGLTSLLVEGGAVTVGHFMRADCVDAVILIRSKRLVLGRQGYDAFPQGCRHALQAYRLSAKTPYCSDDVECYEHV